LDVKERPLPVRDLLCTLTLVTQNNLTIALPPWPKSELPLYFFYFFRTQKMNTWFPASWWSLSLSPFQNWPGPNVIKLFTPVIYEGATTLSIMSLIITMICHYAECRISFSVVSSVIVLSVVMLNVIMLSVVAPFKSVRKKLVCLSLPSLSKPSNVCK